MKSNPFSTRFVRPGQIDWITEDPHTLERMARRFQTELHNRALIVGPHGSGKSTLLEHLVPHLGPVRWRLDSGGAGACDLLPADNGQVIWLSLRRGEMPFQRVWDSRSHWLPGRLLVIDGLEQLNWWQASLTLGVLPFFRMGLLATSHRERLGVPTLLKTQSQLAVLKKIVGDLLEFRPNLPVKTKKCMLNDVTLARLLLEEHGNTREVLMRLYDLFEAADLSNSARGYKVINS